MKYFKDRNYAGYVEVYHDFGWYFTGRYWYKNGLCVDDQPKIFIKNLHLFEPYEPTKVKNSAVYGGKIYIEDPINIVC